MPAISPAACDFVYSDLQDDEDFRELLVDFVAELPQRCASLRQSFAAGHLDEVQSLAHQLKGAGGGYGFATLTDLARELESASKDRETPLMAAALENLVNHLERIRL